MAQKEVIRRYQRELPTAPGGLFGKNTMKQCIRCKEYKTEDNFFKNAISKDGLHFYCRECEKVAKKIQREKHRVRRRKYNRNYRRKHGRGKRNDKKKYEGKKKRSVRWQMEKARKLGDIKPEPCEMCGDPNTVAHHDNYDKPLEVRWLCHSHHMLYHHYGEAYEHPSILGGA